MSGPLRELILLRHAKSDWKDKSLEDIHRPISDKGKKSACKMAHWIKEKSLSPSLVWVSPAKRAQQTLKRLQLPDITQIKTIDSLYLASDTQLLQLLSEVPTDAERVMLIGHNPGFEMLMAHLTKTISDRSVRLFPTAALAHFIMPNDWKNLPLGSGKLANFVRPKEIQLPNSKESE